MSTLYRAIELPSDELVRYVGDYVVAKLPNPDVGFAPIENEDVSRAVARIVHDLRGRRGLSQEWSRIGPDIQDEIAREWTQLIIDELEGGGE